MNQFSVSENHFPVNFYIVIQDPEQKYFYSIFDENNRLLLSYT